MTTKISLLVCVLLAAGAYGHDFGMSEARQLNNLLGGANNPLGGLQQKKSDPNLCPAPCYDQILKNRLQAYRNKGHIYGIKQIMPDCCPSRDKNIHHTFPLATNDFNFERMPRRCWNQKNLLKMLHRRNDPQGFY